MAYKRERERERERESLLLLVCPYVVIYGIMVCITSFSPWCADDFGYWPGREFSFAKILNAEWQQYLNWGGRFVAHLVVRSLLVSNQWLHCILTPLVFTGILLIGQILLWGASWREQTRWQHPVLLFMLFWLFIPSFGQAIFWRTGSGNYCWTSFFALAFLVPFRFLLDNPLLRLRVGQTLLLALLGLCAGWSNENVGIVVFLASAASVIHARRQSGQWPVWAVLCSLVALTGWLLLILAPGNYARLQIDGKNYCESSPGKKLLEYTTFWFQTQRRFLPLHALVAAGIWLNRKNLRTKPVITALSLFFMAHLTLGAFLFSPLPAQRALTMTSMLLCICAAFFLYKNLLHVQLRNICIFALSLFWIISFTVFSIHFSKQLSITMEREKLILRSNQPIIPQYVCIGSRYFYPETLNDFDTPGVKNSALNYYGLKDITIDKQLADKKTTYIVDEVKLNLTKKNHNMIHIHVEDETNSKNIKYKLFYEEYFVSNKRFFTFFIRSLYNLSGIRLDENSKILSILYQTKSIKAGQGIDITTLHGNFSDIKFISYGKTGSKEHKVMRFVPPPETSDN